MQLRRLVLALVMASLAATTVSVPAHATAADRAKRKWVLTYSLVSFSGAWNYTWQLRTTHGVPVRNAKVIEDSRVRGHWTRSDVHRTDANGQFHVIGCSTRNNLARMTVKGTKHRRAVVRTYHLAPCPS